MKKTISLFILLVLSFGTWAQDEPDDKTDRIQSIKVGFITEKLDLSSKEAAVFWPVFNEFDSQIRQIRQKQKENARIFLAKQSPTDQESTQFISDQLTNRQAEVDLVKKYSSEFRKVLPTRKVARLLTLEQEFKQQLLSKMQQRRERMGR